MNTKTLYLAWQDNKEHSRQWFPVGRLDADVKRPLYRYRYIRGAKRAQREAGFQPLPDFPKLYEDYKSLELFPTFKNRVIALGRPDRIDYLHNLDLLENADPIEILSVNGGHRVTDAYEVFPSIVKQTDGSFTCRFFLHGWRHVNQHSQDRIDSLQKAEQLYVTLEFANPATGLAVQIHTTDYYMIGWSPRYLTPDLAMAMAKSPDGYTAKVVRINPQPAPSRQRVLIEMNGSLNEYEYMNNTDFMPLVK